MGGFLVTGILKGGSWSVQALDTPAPPLLGKLVEGSPRWVCVSGVVVVGTSGAVGTNTPIFLWVVSQDCHCDFRKGGDVRPPDIRSGKCHERIGTGLGDHEGCKRFSWAFTGYLVDTRVTRALLLGLTWAPGRETGPAEQSPASHTALEKEKSLYD